MQMFDRLGRTNYIVELQLGVHLDSGETVGWKIFGELNVENDFHL